MYEHLHSLCHGCLSSDRNIFRLDKEMSEIFYKLRNNERYNRIKKDILLCWECTTFLNRLKLFQDRIKTAETLLEQFLQNCYDENSLPSSLSSLTQIHINKYNNIYIKEEYDTSSNKDDFNNSQSDLNSDNDEIKTENIFIDEISNENKLFDNENKLFHDGNIVIDNENIVIDDENIVIDNENLSINDNKLFNDEIKLIDNESKLFNEETKLSDIQIKLVDDENKLFNEIKSESPDIKEELNCSVSDPIEDDKIKKKLSIKKRKRLYQRKMKTYNRNKYQLLATVTQKTRLGDSKEVSETISLSLIEYENVLKRDHGHVDYRKMKNKCMKCKVGYYKRIDLYRHTSFCHNKSGYPHRCNSCTTIINSADDLEVHWNTEHTKVLKCLLCQEIYQTNEDMRKHIKKEHSKYYKCNNCGQEFGDFRKFIRHYKFTHETVICDYCNIKFTEKERLIKHMKRFHIPAKCKLCGKTYSLITGLALHNKVHHPELFSNQETEELSYCVECDRQFPTAFKYRKHLKNSVKHTPPKKIRVPCPDCGKIFSKTTFMKNHYNLAHLKVTKHYCEQCDKYYSTGFSLRQHINTVHKKISLPKNKVCDVCGRGFTTNANLIKHVRTHTGEKPYKCDYCTAAFAQKTAMITHQRTQHKNKVLEAK